MSELYVKPGRHARLVDSPASRVRAEFEGFSPASEAETALDRASLQATAKELGIKANQSNEALAEAIANFEAPEAPTNDRQAPETDDSGSPLES